MRLLLLLFLLHISGFILAQERCYTTTYLAEKNRVNSAETKAISEADLFQKRATGYRIIYEDVVIRIPVVVHVLYYNSFQNISDAQIKSGIEALNRDFRMRNADTLNTPFRFRGLAADVQVEFYLATADPRGRQTGGINRKQTTRNGWIADDKIKMSSQGGLDAWDAKSYLNIWIGNLIGVTGYASVPGSADASDGVVIHYGAFGTINTAAPFNLSRTAVHEVGHWLGLKHIWGDAPCGDDGIADTPQQSYFTKGCPSGFRSSCNNDPAGDMYMNYMDFTDDECMNLFTIGQRQRMRAAFAQGGPRASLLTSKGLNEPWLVESALPVSSNTTLYPNPASDKIHIRVSDDMLGKTILLFNAQGQVQKRVVVQSPLQSIPVSSLAPGVYLLKGEGFSQRFVKL